MHIKSKSGVSPFEAGFGLVAANMIVATSDDVLSAAGPFTLTVDGRSKILT